MKTIVLLLGVVLLSVNKVSIAAPMDLPSSCVFSEVRSNIFIAFSNGYAGETSTNETITFPIDKEIRYGFGSQDIYRHVLALDDQYGCIISAMSESGEEVEGTRYGGKFGKKFLDVADFDLKQLDFTTSRGTGGYSRPYLSIAESDGIVFSRDLPPLESLFKFDKPGKYIVSIQLQCFVGPYGKSTATNVTLVRFPPIKLTVIKEEKK